MGFAAKLQAAQQAQGSPAGGGSGGYGSYAPPSGPPPGQQQQQHQQQYAPPQGPPPNQQQYQNQYQYQPQQQQQQYGAPPSQQAYAPPPSAPPSAGPASFDPQAIERVLRQAVQDQGLAAFYPNPAALAQIAHKVASSGALDHAARLYKLEREHAYALAKLALFDVALLLDDSGSMAFKKWNGERLDDLNLILSRVATTASLFDADGISVRFLNSEREGNHIKNEQDAMNLLNGLEYLYQTPLGGALSKKILNPMLLGPAESGRLQKPLLVILITDGSPSDGDLITRVIKDANARLKRTKYGPDALSIQIAQVGNDLEALEFLAKIDADPVIGDLVDCTSNFESEQDEMKRKTGKDLTPEGWMVKLLMGAVDSSFDLQDEAARTAGGGRVKKQHHSGLKGFFGR